MPLICPLLLIGLLFLPAQALSQANASLTAADTPNDAGNSITLTLPTTSSPDTWFRVSYANTTSGPFELLQEVQATNTGTPQTIKVTELSGPGGQTIPIENGVTWYFKVTATSGGSMSIGGAVPGAAQPNYFNTDHTANFAITVGFSALLFILIATARRRDLQIRRLAGLDALDEALGRATEMGKSVLFVHGLHEINSASTIAAVNVLGQVARKAAEFGTKLEVANRYPLTMSVSQEVVREACIEVGRPDVYNEDAIFLAAADQFSYAAALEGRMMRDEPAANIMMGYFYAESLLLAETGSRTGAIQIAGSDAYTQLPFFITTCDYTLMGEELYAASAYLSRDPRLLGSIKAQDVAKAALVALILIGVLASAIGYDFIGSGLA